MANRFLISVAALALIAGTGFANAQGTGGREQGGAQMQNAPSSAGGGAATQNRESGGSAAKENSESSKSSRSPGMTEQKSPTAGQNQRAEENMHGSKKGMSSENERNTRTEGQGHADEMNAQGRNRTNDMNAQGQNRTNDMNAQTRNGTDRSHVTTGQAGASAKLSTDQRTRITSVIRNEHVAPVNNVDFAVSVGTRVPRERVSLRPLPTEVATIYPQWRGYEFFVVHDQIVVVDPRTLEIVEVLES